MRAGKGESKEQTRYNGAPAQDQNRMPAAERGAPPSYRTQAMPYEERPQIERDSGISNSVNGTPYSIRPFASGRRHGEEGLEIQ